MQCVPYPKKRETNANIADSRSVKQVPAINVMDEHGKWENIKNDKLYQLVVSKCFRHYEFYLEALYKFHDTTMLHVLCYIS